MIKDLPAKVLAVTLALSAIVLLQLGGCKDSGSVGGSFPGGGADLQVDTLEISQIESVSLESFSGSREFFSIGSYQDPLFGDITATGLIKPFLAPVDTNLSFDQDTEMRMRVAISQDTVYGDTLAGTQFNVVELANVFRGNEVRLNDDVATTGPTVGSFTVNDEDSIDVQLSDAWVQEYGMFYNMTDSTRFTEYEQEFPGLAIVPQNSAKILAINPDRTQFIVSDLNVAADADSTVRDSLNINTDEWAYSLNRSNVQAPDPSSSKIINTLESVITFDFDFSFENMGTRNISRVELVIYRDNLMLEQSISQPNVVRPIGGTLNLFLVDEDELPQSIDPGPNGVGAIAAGSYQEEDEAYHIDITNTVLNLQLQEIDSDQTFYLTLGRNNGTISSSLLFDSQAPPEKTPKVIVTSIKTEDN